MLTRTIFIVCVFVAFAEAGKLSFSPSQLRNVTSYDGQSRIVGGVPAELGDYPFQASLRELQSKQHFCGGSIVTTKHILTAAHCMGGQFSVVVGTIKLSSSGVEYQVQSISIHPQYETTFHQNDIALVELTTEIQLTPVINIAKLPASQTANGVLTEVSGWGFTRSDLPEPSETLMKLTNYPIFDLTECMNIIHHPVFPGKICAGSTPGKGTCRGDSGGPLSLSGTVIGIVSLVTNPCAVGYPDVFTNVFYYTTWMKTYTGSYSHELQFV